WIAGITPDAIGERTLRYGLTAVADPTCILIRIVPVVFDEFRIAHQPSHDCADVMAPADTLVRITGTAKKEVRQAFIGFPPDDSVAFHGGYFVSGIHVFAIPNDSAVHDITANSHRTVRKLLSIGVVERAEISLWIPNCWPKQTIGHVVHIVIPPISPAWDVF